MKKTPVRKMKKGEDIAFETVDGKWHKGKVVRRTGKASGKYNTRWNIMNVHTGHVQAEDTNAFDQIEEISDGKAQNVEMETFIMNIPRHLHNEKRCIEAKEKELKCWDNFDVYDEIVNEGQPKIGTNWVLTEKVINGVSGVKARLTVRGDQEETNDLRKDSPTVR